MTSMKDYAMWLDDKGIAEWSNQLGELIIPEGVDIYDAITVRQYTDDAGWHGYPEEQLEAPDPNERWDPDDDEYNDDTEEDDDDFLDDDEVGDYIEYSPEEFWYSPTDGLTDYANEMLYTQDSKGELV